VRLAIVAVALLLGATATAQEVLEDPSALPEGAHRAEVFYLCTACHSSRLVRNQALSRERWDETLTWMTDRQDMPELIGEERARVLDYLAAALGPDDRAGPSRTPFLTPPATQEAVCTTVSSATAVTRRGASPA
jgi:hypothetical protein